MKKTALPLITAVFFLFSSAAGQEIYQWKDEKGASSFTDDPSLIPEKYRSRSEQKKFPRTQPSSPASPADDPGNTGADPATQPGAARKDRLGRDEAWWRNKAGEWNEKLLAAQKQYEISFAAWKKKERELDESKFKPDSLKRKLKAEIKVLEQETKDREREKTEAKEMLEAFLPKEAEDCGADPSWIKIE